MNRWNNSVPDMRGLCHGSPCFTSIALVLLHSLRRCHPDQRLCWPSSSGQRHTALKNVFQDDSYFENADVAVPAHGFRGGSQYVTTPLGTTVARHNNNSCFFESVFFIPSQLQNKTKESLTGRIPDQLARTFFIVEHTAGTPCR